MRRLLAALALVLLWTQSAYADSPIPPHTWERAVGSYRFVMLDPYDRTPQAAEGMRYPAAGLYRADGPPEPLWTVDWYAHEGEVFLSADGEYLARMGPWPQIDNFDELAVAFYRNGALTKSYRVRDLVEKPDSLPRSVSHYGWHGDVAYDPTQMRLTVATVTGLTYLFDVRTGSVISPSAQVGGEDPGAGGLTRWIPVLTWGFSGVVVAGGVWVVVRRVRRA